MQCKKYAVSSSALSPLLCWKCNVSLSDAFSHSKLQIFPSEISVQRFAHIKKHTRDVNKHTHARTHGGYCQLSCCLVQLAPLSGRTQNIKLYGVQNWRICSNVSVRSFVRFPFGSMSFHLHFSHTLAYSCLNHVLAISLHVHVTSHLSRGNLDGLPQRTKNITGQTGTRTHNPKIRRTIPC